jgi:hypothetical protein
VIRPERCGTGRRLDELAPGDRRAVEDFRRYLAGAMPADERAAYERGRDYRAGDERTHALTYDDSHLPTVPELIGRSLDELDAAAKALEEARAWLVRSDWRPAGSALTGAQSAARQVLATESAAATAAIERATEALLRALP